MKCYTHVVKIEKYLHELKCNDVHDRLLIG